MNLRNAATLSVVAMMTVVGRTAAREIIGPAVGVRTLDIVDASRHDLLRPDLDREWTVTVLYPARASAVAERRSSTYRTPRSFASSPTR